MSDMDPTPAPILETNIKIETLFCSVEEQDQRLEACKTCSRFWSDEENKTYCLQENKTISYMITETEASCPLDRW